MKLRYIAVVNTALTVVLWSYPQSSVAQQVLNREQAPEAIEIENLRVEHDSISGKVHNKFPYPVRDIELLIRQSWSWNNEFRPGKDDPGMASYHTVGQEISPGASVTFDHKLSPSPARKDGRFDTTVSVAGFTKVIPQ